MTAQFNVSLLIRGDGSDAEAALQKTGAAVRGLGDATEATGRKTAVLGAAQRKAAGDAQALTASNRLAAGSVGNLAANFNDIGVMLAAGQSPLQLALQQGTQISQVLGPMGAAGAVRALGAGLLQLVNPVSLITIGSIAAGAAMFQWLTGAGEKAKTLEDLLGDAKGATDAMGKANATAAKSVADLTAEFGAQAEAIRDLARADAEAEYRTAARSLGGAGRAIVDSFRDQGIAIPLAEIGDQQNLASLLGLSDWTGLDMFDQEVRRTVNRIGAALQEFDLASSLANDGLRLEAMVASAERLRQKFEDAAEQSGRITDEENAILQSIIGQQVALARLQAERQRTLRAQAADLLAERAVDRGDTPRDIRRRTADGEARAQIADLRQEAQLRALIRQYGEDSLSVAYARRDAEQAAFAVLVDQSGASAELRAELMAAWDAANGIGASNFAATIASALGFSREMVSDLDSAWDAALGIEGADMAGPVSAAAAAAGVLFGNLDASVGAVGRFLAAWGEVGRSYGPSAVFMGPDGQPVIRGKFTEDGMDKAKRDAMRDMPNPFGRLASGAAGVRVAKSGSAGGGGGAARDEADAVAALIERLRAEGEMARETDPVRREMLGLRKELAGATDAQRAEVEALIRSNRAEAETYDLIAARSEAVREMGRDAIGSILDGLREGASLGDIFIGVLDRIADKLSDLAADQISAALFPKGGGGLLDGLIGAIFPRPGGGAPTVKAATGRVIDRPTLFSLGDGRLGEMAEAGAEAIMPLTHAFGGGVGASVGGREMSLPLTRLVSGKLGVDLSALAEPFARGAAFGNVAEPSLPATWRRSGAMGRSEPAPAPTVIQLQPTFVNNTGRPMAMEVEETVDARGQRQQKYVFSDASATGLATPGGSAARALRQQFGLKPQARSRG